MVGPLRVGLRWSPSINSSGIAVQNFSKLGLALFVLLVRGRFGSRGICAMPACHGVCLLFVCSLRAACACFAILASTDGVPKFIAASPPMPLRKFCDKILDTYRANNPPSLVLEIDQAYRDVTRF